MATSSIKKNFVIETEEQARMFVSAIEEARRENIPRKKVSARQITGEKEILQLMKNKE